MYLGGASGSSKKIFIQKANGTFTAQSTAVFEEDIAAEDVDGLFFDADNDKDLDLYVVTGSNEFSSNAPQLADRLYLNDGKGNFTKDLRLPNIAESGSCIASSDFDKDGDIDLFIGGRLVPGQYGYDPPSFLYVNDGTGAFKNYTKRYLPANEIGMVTDAVWEDIDGDTYPELVVAGDWMPVMVFKNENGRKLTPVSASGIPKSEGWWNAIKPSDIDGDGDTDFIVGNQGGNSRITASAKKPASLYVNDFEKNGTVEQIIACYSEDGKAYPMVLKHDLQRMVPGIKKRFVKYSDYAGKNVQELFPEAELKETVVKKVTNPHTTVFINEGNFTFSQQALPIEAQFAPVWGIETLDYNEDGLLDIVLAGNFFEVLPEIGRYDASYGWILQGKGKGKFETVTIPKSGFFVRGQVRKIQIVRGAGNQELIILAKNNDPVQIYTYRRKMVQ